jgi:hypothetical protein
MSYIDDNRKSNMNRLPTDAEVRQFRHTMEFLVKEAPPKRITVNMNGQRMLNEWIERNPALWPDAWRAVPVTCSHEQSSPYIAHNV